MSRPSNMVMLRAADARMVTTQATWISLRAWSSTWTRASCRIGSRSCVSGFQWETADRSSGCAGKQRLCKTMLQSIQYLQPCSAMRSQAHAYAESGQQMQGASDHYASLTSFKNSSASQLHLGVDARGSHLKLEGAAYNCADFR